MDAYAVIADVLMFFHLVYVAVVAVGALVIVIGGVIGWRGVRNSWFRGIHLLMTTVVALEAIIVYECPLTTLEWALRVEAGQFPPDFREKGTSSEALGFIARMLQYFLAADMSILTYVFIGVGVAVALALLFWPPRQVFTIMTLNAVCLATLFVFWLYAGQPDRWGQGTWPHGVLVGVWNALPFVLAGGMAIQLRPRAAASSLLCTMVILLSWRGLFLLKCARVDAGASGLSAIEWALPIAELLVLFVTFRLARLMVVRQPAAPSPRPSVEGTGHGG